MIESVAIKDPKDADAKALLTEGVSHICFLPSLRGRTFNFTKGLNVIIGENGSGKTSLLSVIRQLWLAEYEGKVEPSSHNMFSMFFGIKFTRHFDEGLYEMVDMKADYTKPLFCLRKAKDIKNENVLGSAMNMLQFMQSNEMSNGESVTCSIVSMIKLMQGKHPTQNAEEYMDFQKTLGYIRESGEKMWGGNRSGIHGRDCKRMFDFFMDYFDRNKVEPSNCLTAVLDEPDDGMDIYRLDQLRKLFAAVHRVRKDQFIIVLHNVALIKALSELDGVNFIEITDGYLDAVKAFGTDKEIAEREEHDIEEEHENLVAERESFRHALSKRADEEYEARRKAEQERHEAEKDDESEEMRAKVTADDDLNNGGFSRMRRMRGGWNDDCSDDWDDNDPEYRDLL